MTDQQNILAEVAAERVRQDKKWGVQNHPLWFETSAMDHEYWAAQADMWKRTNDRRVSQATAAGLPSGKNCAWDGIYVEEVCEAFGEASPGLQYSEFVQSAGVAIAILEKLNRDAIEKTGHHASCPSLDHEWIVTAPEACDCVEWFGPRFEERALDSLFDTWGVWDKRDQCWERGFDHNSRREARAYASRMNEESV